MHYINYSSDFRCCCSRSKWGCVYADYPGRRTRKMEKLLLTFAGWEHKEGGAEKNFHISMIETLNLKWWKSFLQILLIFILYFWLLRFKSEASWWKMLWKKFFETKSFFRFVAFHFLERRKFFQLRCWWRWSIWSEHKVDNWKSFGGLRQMSAELLQVTELSWKFFQ